MLEFLNSYSRSRKAWLFLALASFGLETIELWFQHVIELKPCVFCIYERCALLGIIGAGLTGAIAPKTLLRYVAIIIWLYSAWKGLALSWEYTMIQLYPSPFKICSFTANFPSWLPLDKWLPQLFMASEDCSMRQWEFLTLKMSQWLVGVFMIYFIGSLLVLIAQLFKPKKRVFSGGG